MLNSSDGYTPALNLPEPILYIWVERGTVRVKYLAQQHNTMLGLAPWLLPTESSTLTMKRQHLPKPMSMSRSGFVTIMDELTFKCILSPLRIWSTVHVPQWTRLCMTLTKLKNPFKVYCLPLEMSVICCDFDGYFQPLIKSYLTNTNSTVKRLNKSLTWSSCYMYLWSIFSKCKSMIDKSSIGTKIVNYRHWS